MLAQNFKTAEELNISETEQRALVTVLYMLERGEILIYESPKNPNRKNHPANDNALFCQHEDYCLFPNCECAHATGAHP